MSKIAESIYGICEDIAVLSADVFGDDDWTDLADEMFSDFVDGDPYTAEWELFVMLGNGRDPDVLGIWSRLEPWMP